MKLNVSAQNLRPGDVVEGPMFKLRVVRSWVVEYPALGLRGRVIYVVWKHLDIDHRVTLQFLPSDRFEVERVGLASDRRND